MDLAVRSLDPATEKVSRESYGALHPDKSRPHQVKQEIGCEGSRPLRLLYSCSIALCHPPPWSIPPPPRHQEIAGYAQTLAEQGFLLTHWEVVRDLWLDALRNSPYMEAYELRNMKLGKGSAAHRFFELHVLRPMAGAISMMEAVYQDESNAQLVRTSIQVLKCQYPYRVRSHHEPP